MASFARKWVGKMESTSSGNTEDLRENDQSTEESVGNGVPSVDLPGGHSEESNAPPKEPVAVSTARGASKALRTVLVSVAIPIAAVVGIYVLIPMVQTAMNTVSTDDAYVNGHVTFVAPRVAGQVAKVYVDDNYRVKKGDLLVQLDKEPYQVQVAIKQAAVDAAESDLGMAEARAYAQAGQARSNRYRLEHAIETVRDQIATLKSNVAQLQVEKANLELAEKDYIRNVPLVKSGAVSQAGLDQYSAKRDVAISRVNSASQIVQQTRAGLGLPINYEDPLSVPDDLEQNYSLVRQALQQMAESVAAIGFYPKSWSRSPQEIIDEFHKQDPEGDVERIYSKLISQAPGIRQAKARLEQAKRDLAEAELNLRYCDVVSEIDGVVTRRAVNPGNNVQAGQSLMAVRSVTEIWIDANFKETQLADLRIGQRVRCEVDMYGSRKEFEGRITGFTMGTGTTLSLLPPQNATGNFVKIVQRLPVRIELKDYDPGEHPLFTGLSVVPYVYIYEPPSGPHAGDVLQPVTELETSVAEPQH